jgi:membrane protein implicated in regulation of membrane protease activity
MSATILWLAAGAVFIGVEIFGIPGIGFLFAGIAALIVGGAVEFGVIAADNISFQFLLFFAFTSISAAVLWKKLKKNPKPNYNNIVGTEAIVVGDGLVGNKEGQVKWSGTLMRARLVPNAGMDVISADTVVIVKSIEGNLLYVARRD